jgi:Protein of unknown function (DUF2849)
MSIASTMSIVSIVSSRFGGVRFQSRSAARRWPMSNLAPRASARVITANLLRSGDVVYLGDAGHWVDDLDRATVIVTADQMAVHAATAAASVAARIVTAVYAFDVGVVGGRPTPLSIRETIRASHAPTV